MLPDTVIGDRYIVKRKLAEGGMAEIYLCTAMGTEGFEKEVVLKCIRSFWGSDDMFIQMFIAEARLASRLNHANIVQIFHFDKHEESYYLAMEFVNGPSLRDFLKKIKDNNTPLPILLASEITANIARGLHYAHNLNIVHRDVSPHNILLSYDGNIKLADFGIAKTGSQLTSPGVLKGKFAYMAPEQARGEAVDARTDVFALGIVLWEALTLTRLFEYDSYVNALQALQENLIVQPSRFNPLVPPELDRIVLKALKRNPAERYQTAQEFERALLNFILSHARSADDTNLSHFLQTLYGHVLEPLKENTQTRTYTPPSAPSRPAQGPAPSSLFPSQTLQPIYTRPEPLPQPSSSSFRRKTPTPRPPPAPGPPALTKAFPHRLDKPTPLKLPQRFAQLLRHPAALFVALLVSATVGVYGTLQWERLKGLFSRAEPKLLAELPPDVPQPIVVRVPPPALVIQLEPPENGSASRPQTLSPSARTVSMEKPVPPPEGSVPPEKPVPPEGPLLSERPPQRLEHSSTPRPVEPSPPPAEVKSSTPVSKEARLTVTTAPWAFVKINNGREVEVVGKRAFRLPPGTHQVRFRFPLTSTEEVRSVHILHPRDHKTIHFQAPRAK